MSPCSRLVKLKLGATNDDLMAKVDVLLKGCLKANYPGLPVNEGQHVDEEGRLHRRMLKKVVEHLLWLGISSQLDNDAHPLSVRFIAQFSDAFNPSFLDQIGDPLHQRCLVYLVGELGDHYLEASLGYLHDISPSPEQDPASSRRVGIIDSLQTIDNSCRGEIWSRDEIGELIHSGFWVINEMGDGMAYFTQIVRWNVSRHADSDS